MVLSRLTFRVISTKVPQDLTLIRRISGAVCETGFWFALWAIYISFSALTSALSRCGASLRQGVFSSLIPDDLIQPKTSTFSTRGLILVNKKLCINFLNQFFFSYFNSARHSLVTELCLTLKTFYFFLRLLIKLAHSFVAIELLDFFKNAKFHFYCSRELSVKKIYIHKQDYYFLLSVCIRMFWIFFLYINEYHNNCHKRKTMCTFQYILKAKNCETFSYTKSQKLFKNQNNIRYDLYIKIKTLYFTQFFMKFWSWNLYIKSMTLFVTWRFYIQKARHFAKIKTLCVRFLYTKIPSKTAETGVWNQNSAGWSGDRQIMVFPRKWISKKDFTSRKLADFGWWRRRRRALTAVALRFFNAKWRNFCQIAPPPRPKRHHISAGDREAAVVYCGVLYFL